MTAAAARTRTSRATVTCDNVQCQVTTVTTSAVTESVAAAPDDCSEVCLMALHDNFMLVPYRHAQFCERCAR